MKVLEKKTHMLPPNKQFSGVMYTNLGKQIKVIHFFNQQVQCSIKDTPNLWKNLNGSLANAV